MARREWQAGDRVRLRSESAVNAFLPDFRGTVLGGKEASPGGWEWYFVRMDGQPIGSWVVLRAEEIEAEGAMEEAEVGVLQS